MWLVPLLAGLYLTRVPELSTTTPAPDSPSLARFEAVLLALYSSQTMSREGGGKPILVSVPTPGYLASHSSLYHYVPPPVSKSPQIWESAGIGIGVVCAPLEPQVGIKSTKRACIIGVAFHCFYNHISQMRAWSQIELCRFAATWAGNPCPCSTDECEDDENVVNDEGGRRIRLSWELLQPMLRILGHCLMGPPPIILDDIKEAAAVAVWRFYARASHDLCPQAILATRALVQLHARANAAPAAASTVTTPTSVKKSPEMLLLSQ